MPPLGRPILLILLLTLATTPSCGEPRKKEARVSEAARAFLRPWARALGDERDASSSGYPKRIERARDGGIMVFVSGGRFLMGAVAHDREALDDEKPRHEVVLGPFYMDETEVTRGQFAAFAKDTKYVTDAEKAQARKHVSDRESSETWKGRLLSEGPIGATHPVGFMSHRDARTYAHWAACELPSEAQFEFVLRGGLKDKIYPWGNELEPPHGQGNFSGKEVREKYPWWNSAPVGNYEDPFIWTSPVRTFAANAFGVYDIDGNVAEWCQDVFAYFGEEVAGPYNANASHVNKGGSWNAHPGRLRCSWRASAGKFRMTWGFRCVRAVPGAE